MIKYYTSYT